MKVCIRKMCIYLLIKSFKHKSMKTQLFFIIGLLAMQFAIAQDTLNYTGAVQYYVVPACVDSITIHAWGAEGGIATDKLPNNSDPGKGGYASGKLGVNPGDTIWVYVGGKGHDTQGTGGWNGGGNGGYGSPGSSCFGGNGGGGGGASDIRINGQALNNRILVAGGGGGAGRDYCNGTCQPCGCGGSGGAGGATTGVNGNAAYNCGYNYPGNNVNFGSGGTQGAGGLGGPCDLNCGNVGTPGALGIGGNGSNGTQDVAGGGGGGGYYGGGGGGGASNGNGIGGGGGAGGSSYIGGVVNGSTTQNIKSANGLVVIVPNQGIPAVPAIINGPNAVCEGDTAIYSISPVPNTTGYTWTVPSGANIVTGQNTISLTVAFGSNSGNVTVTADNSCGSSAPAILPVTVNALPVVALSVNPDSICSSAPAATLSGGSPSGGVYAGTGVSGGSFNPIVAGIGTHTILYTYTDGNGCSGSASDQIVVYICAGINELNNGYTMQVFPNPFSDIATVRIDSEELTSGTYEIADYTGKVIEQATFSGNTFSISKTGKANGIYTITVKKQNTPIVVSKLMIQ